jgi:hypothetical protein
VERFNRTLKSKMWHFFTEKNTRRWVDELPALLRWYNTRVHRKLKMSPMEAVKLKNKKKVESVQSYPADTGGEKRPQFSIGDTVRISRIKGIFEKGYHAGWSQEVFTVVEVRQPFSLSEPITYTLRDRSGEVLQGSFYTEELQKVKYPDVLLVESVLKKKKVGSETQLLVKWLGYNEKMNSWIPENQVLDFLGKPKYEVVSATPTKIRLKRLS